MVFIHAHTAPQVKVPGEPLRFACASSGSENHQLRIQRIPEYKVNSSNSAHEQLGLASLTIEHLAAKSHALAAGSTTKFQFVDPPESWRESRRTFQNMAGDRGVELALCVHLLQGCPLQSDDAHTMVNRVVHMSQTVTVELIKAKAAGIQSLSYDAVLKERLFNSDVSTSVAPEHVHLLR
jgi:hypothetical protein